MIHPQFLEESLCTEPYINILDLTQELEQEAGLIPDQHSRPFEAAASQDAEKHKHCTDQGVCTPNWPPEVTSQDLKRRRATEPELWVQRTLRSSQAVKCLPHWGPSGPTIHPRTTNPPP
uniref:NUT family member 2D-like n=1 Tax=Ictidomys tridecemlineatus TaxID=43179 RepID=UPI001A9E6E41|nr:NUT family member 2D-like [Ictidomys tridecemlineatus]